MGDASYRGLGKVQGCFQSFCEILKLLMEDEKEEKGDPFQLRVLKLNYNNLNDSHVETLLELVQDCTKLERLWLSCNDFNDGGCWKIINRCAKNKNLAIILLGNKGWSLELLHHQ